MRSCARSRVGVHARRDAVGREHHRRALGHLGLVLHEHRAAVAQLLDHVLVVDDLLAHVDRRAVELERALDRLHGAVDARAVAARRGEQQLLGTEAIADSVGGAVRRRTVREHDDRPQDQPDRSAMTSTRTTSVVRRDGLEQVGELTPRRLAPGRDVLARDAVGGAS